MLPTLQELGLSTELSRAEREAVYETLTDEQLDAIIWPLGRREWPAWTRSQPEAFEA